MELWTVVTRHKWGSVLWLLLLLLELLLSSGVYLLDNGTRLGLCHGDSTPVQLIVKSSGRYLGWYLLMNFLREQDVFMWAGVLLEHKSKQLRDIVGIRSPAHSVILLLVVHLLEETLLDTTIEDVDIPFILRRSGTFRALGQFVAL